jgi:nucleotide-binding universal stress UspA family protein
VAHELLTKVDVPIFAIGPHAHDAVTHVALRHILHPVSFRDDNQESFHLAFGIAQAYGAQLTLLHVSDQKFQDRINPLRTVDWAKNAMEALIPAVTDLASPVHMRVTSGDLAEEVLNEAIHTNADLIVLGTDGGFRPWSFRETAAYKVLTEANCPVLTVRHEPHQIVTKD